MCKKREKGKGGKRENKNGEQIGLRRPKLRHFDR